MNANDNDYHKQVNREVKRISTCRGNPVAVTQKTEVLRQW